MAENSPTGKVSIVAHSNGGLVTRNLLKYLEETNHSLLEKIDKVIFVGSPLLGTPKTVGELLHGTTAADGTVRDVEENMPGVYGLLPSRKLFDNVDDAVIEVSSLVQLEYPFKSYYDIEISLRRIYQTSLMSPC